MKRIGIVGAGQLGQMLGYAAKAIDVECVYLDPSDNPPAATAGKVLKHAFDDPAGLRELAMQSDIITYEFENVPVSAIEKITQTIDVFPPPAALRYAQDRLVEKTMFRDLGIPVADFMAVDSLADLERACTTIGLPLVLKTRRMGYDGKGQSVLTESKDAQQVLLSLGGKDLIAEQWIAFDREVSAIGARNVSGELAFYPLTENHHRDGILRESRAPSNTSAIDDKARQFLRDLLEHIGYVGVIALELFVVGDELLANEFAPRVHNSGHWTIEGAQTSQFENHLRAILDMPLGGTETTGFAAMVNLIGEIPDRVRRLGPEEAWLHEYGKKPRPGRKLGHLSIVRQTPQNRETALKQLGKLLKN